MRILHVYKDYPPVLGGIEGHLQLLAEGQARLGHQVTVLVTARGPRTTVRHENGVEVIRAARLATLASTPLSLSLPRQLATLRPDLTHLQFPYPPGELAQLLLGRSRATVVTYQSDIVRQRLLGWLYRPLMWRLLRRADAILATSAAYRDSSPVLSRLGERCRVVPLGIDVERFSQSDPRSVTDFERRFPEPRILFVGRLRYYKGVEHLIDAMAQLGKASLLIAGRGPLEDKLHRQAAASPVADRIHFLGDIPAADLPALYQAADIFVLPATRRSEAFGLVQVEAMAAGLPVISTELGTGTSFVNRHGETGLVVPPADTDALATALSELLGSVEERRRLGDGARRRAWQRFDVRQMIERTLEVYSEVLTDHTH